jgi:hypothetical protein
MATIPIGYIIYSMAFLYAYFPMALIPISILIKERSFLLFQGNSFFFPSYV